MASCNAAKDQVGQHLDVVGIDHIGADPHRLVLAVALHVDFDLAATGGTGQEQRGLGLLCLGQLALHCLGGLEERIQVETAEWIGIGIVGHWLS